MLKKSLRKKDLWIGLVCVKQTKRDGVLGYAHGAYVNALAPDVDRSDFSRRIEKQLGELDLELVSLEDAETLTRRQDPISLA